MAENPISGTVPALTGPKSRPAGSAILVRSSSFKYYIHDGIECCRLQLIGDLSDLDVADLTGCWNTARTTLGRRKLILDLTALTKTDESGHEWLLSMVREGATSLPESYFRDHLAGRDQHIAAAEGSSASLSKLMRLVNLLRGSREVEVESFSGPRARRSRP